VARHWQLLWKGNASGNGEFLIGNINGLAIILAAQSTVMVLPAFSIDCRMFAIFIVLSPRFVCGIQEEIWLSSALAYCRTLKSVRAGLVNAPVVGFMRAAYFQFLRD